MVEAGAGTFIHDAWMAYTIVHKRPFYSWKEFANEAKAYFLTTETRTEAVKKLRDISQGGKTIEEFIIEFKGWAHLSGFDNIALVN